MDSSKDVAARLGAKLLAADKLTAAQVKDAVEAARREKALRVLADGLRKLATWDVQLAARVTDDARCVAELRKLAQRILDTGDGA